LAIHPYLPYFDSGDYFSRLSAVGPLVFTAALSVVGKYVDDQFPATTLQISGSLVSFVAVTFIFAMMFKCLPDVKVDWRDVGLGAAITAALFELGKLLIGIYIGRQALDSTYGAAASLVVLLIWIYYSAQILLLGAEFTHVYPSVTELCCTARACVCGGSKGHYENRTGGSAH